MKKRTQNGEWITEEQAARIMGVKKVTLLQRRYKKQPNPPHVKSGRSVLYKLEDVRAFVKDPKAFKHSATNGKPSNGDVQHRVSFTLGPEQAKELYQSLRGYLYETNAI